MSHTAHCKIWYEIVTFRNCKMPSYKKRKENNVKAKIGVKKAFNPFEVRVNRKKHNVLGQKSKSEVGKPGISRSRSIQKVKG